MEGQPRRKEHEASGGDGETRHNSAEVSACDSGAMEAGAHRRLGRRGEGVVVVARLKHAPRRRFVAVTAPAAAAALAVAHAVEDLLHVHLLGVAIDERVGRHVEQTLPLRRRPRRLLGLLLGHRRCASLGVEGEAALKARWGRSKRLREVQCSLQRGHSRLVRLLRLLCESAGLEREVLRRAARKVIERSRRTHKRCAVRGRGGSVANLNLTEAADLAGLRVSDDVQRERGARGL